MLLICLSNEKSESKVIPRLFTWSVSAICTPATATDADYFSLPTLWAVPNIATSDLSGLRAKELWSSHSYTATVQPARSRVAFDKLFFYGQVDLRVIYVLVEFDAETYMISPNGIVNSKKSSRPRTDPCGMPVSEPSVVDMALPTLT